MARSPQQRYATALRATAPGDDLVIGIEISHPALADPVRVVVDDVDRMIGGERFVAVPARVELADDVPGRAPVAQIVIDNVGRDLTAWIEASQGGAGAVARLLLCLADDEADDEADDRVAGTLNPEYDVTMDVQSIRASGGQIIATLGYDPLLGRAAVAIRHDPQAAPGLYR